jgi:hypothetical protein
MDGLMLYFFGVLAYNVATGLVAFIVAYSSYRKRLAISGPRGTVVLLGGWILGSVIVFLVHYLLAVFGIDAQKPDGLETVIALGVQVATMFVLFPLVCRPAAAGEPAPRPL